MIALLLRSKMVVGLLSFVGVIALIGIFAPWIAPHDPYANDILIKFAPYSLDHPLGTDHLGRYDVIFSEPNYDLCCYCLTWCRCTEYHHCQRYHQMGVVCSNDSY